MRSRPARALTCLQTATTILVFPSPFPELSVGLGSCPLPERAIKSSSSQLPPRAARRKHTRDLVSIRGEASKSQIVTSVLHTSQASILSFSTAPWNLDYFYPPLLQVSLSQPLQNNLAALHSSPSWSPLPLKLNILPKQLGWGCLPLTVSTRLSLCLDIRVIAQEVSLFFSGQVLSWVLNPISILSLQVC